MIEFRLEVEPVAKPRMTKRDKWAKRPCVMRYWDFCDQLRTQAVKNGYDPTEILSIVFILPMPSSWSQRKRDTQLGKPHRQTPDLDNLIKAFQDALLKDDSGVHTYGSMHKVWGDIGEILILSHDEVKTKAHVWVDVLKAK